MAAFANPGVRVVKAARAGYHGCLRGRRNTARTKPYACFAGNCPQIKTSAPCRRRLRAPQVVLRTDTPMNSQASHNSTSLTRVRTVVDVPIQIGPDSTVTAQFITFDGLRDGREHFAVRFGAPEGEAPLVRLHSECLTGDVFGSARCDCGPQLHDAIHRLSKLGGYLLYLRQEGRGIGLIAKLDAYRLQDQGMDTFAANRALGHADDERDYRVAADMLEALGVAQIKLLTNNPDKRRQLEAAGIKVAEMVPTGVFLGAHNRSYLEAKVKHSGHILDLRKHRVA